MSDNPLGQPAKPDNGVPFSKSDYARLVALDGKIDLLTQKFDSLAQSMHENMQALRDRDNAQAEKLDAQGARITSLERAADQKSGEANALARAWSIGASVVGMMVNGLILFFDHRR